MWKKFKDLESSICNLKHAVQRLKNHMLAQDKKITFNNKRMLRQLKGFVKHNDTQIRNEIQELRQAIEDMKREFVPFKDVIDPKFNEEDGTYVINIGGNNNASREVIGESLCIPTKNPELHVRNINVRDIEVGCVYSEEGSGFLRVKNNQSYYDIDDDEP